MNQKPHLYLVVVGEPQAKQRPRRNSKTNHWYTPRETGDAENTIAWHARSATTRFKGSVMVDLRFHTKNTKLDLDNLAKTVLDALVKAGTIEDDRKVEWLTLSFVRSSEHPQTEILVGPFDGGEAIKAVDRMRALPVVPES